MNGIETGWERGWSWRDILRLHEHAPRQSAPECAVVRHRGDGIDAIVLLRTVVARLRDDLDATIAIAPQRSSFDLRTELAHRLLSVARQRRAVLLLGVEHRRASWDGGWIVPYSTPWSAPVMPVARIVSARAGLRRPPDPRALRCTGIVAAHGPALLDIYERLVPRLLRWVLFEAEGDALERGALPRLDLHADLLAFAHDLGCAAVACSETRGWQSFRIRHREDPAAPPHHAISTTT